jgi:uncharacterized damage-inducible protein DinB
MKKSFLILVIIFIQCAGLFAQQTDPLIKEFLQKWEHSKAYTLEMVKAMPASQLDFKPVEGERTFRQQVVHLVSNMVWLSSSYLGHEKFEPAPDEKNKYSKEQLLDLVTRGYTFSEEAVRHLSATDLEDTVPFFAGPMSKRQILNLMDDHATHHRGQLIVYLRLNGIVPPEYSGW